ncbi:unnamed protein product, partial [Prunus brigantina]
IVGCANLTAWCSEPRGCALTRDVLLLDAVRLCVGVPARSTVCHDGDEVKTSNEARPSSSRPELQCRLVVVLVAGFRRCSDALLRERRLYDIWGKYNLLRGRLLVWCLDLLNVVLSLVFIGESWRDNRG